MQRVCLASLTLAICICLAFAPSTSARPVAVNHLLQLGRQSLEVLQHNEARSFAQRALRAANQSHDISAQIQALNIISYVHWFQRKPSEALTTARNAQRLAHAKRDIAGQAEALLIMTRVHLDLNRLNEAEQAVKEALILSERVSNPLLLAQVYRLLGQTNSSRGNYEVAFGNYSRSIQFFQQAKSRRLEANALADRGLVRNAQGRLLDAARDYKLALDIQTEFGDYLNMSLSYTALSNIYRRLGNYSEAIRTSKKAFNAARQNNDRENLHATLVNLSYLYLALGDNQKAANYAEQALKESQNSQEQGYAFDTLSQAYARLGKPERALGYSQRAVQFFKQANEPLGMGDALVNLAARHAEMGHPQLALEHAHQALQQYQTIGAPDGEAFALLGIGKLQRQAHEPGALRTALRARGLARKVNSGLLNWQAAWLLGQVLDDLKEPYSARLALQDAIASIEQQRSGLQTDQLKLGFFETTQAPYTDLIALLNKQNHPEQALEMSERARARAFIDLLAQNLQDRTPLNDERLRSIKQLQENTALAQQDGSFKPAQQIALRTRAGQLLSILKATDSERASHLSVDPPNFEQIKHIAREQSTTLLVYQVLADDTGRWDGLLIWVVSPEGKLTTHLQELEDKPDFNLSVLLSQFHPVRGLQLNVEPRESDPLQAQKALNELYTLLIRPIADALPRDPRALVTVIPHRELFGVPFAALLDSDGQYLIDQHTLSYAPSIQVLDFTRQKQQRLQKLPPLNAALVMGNPKMPSTELQPLPGSETEARAIASTYRVPALTGADASETNFKQLAEGQSVIHLATHGLVNQREVLASSIVLSKDDKNDGFLTAAEVFELKLNAQLVVLSACETGLGALTGDGVVGLSRAFISAGTPSVLVSLWPVEDQTTARVMEAFHRRWSGVPLATALREAMLEMKNQGLGPAQWAAFSLIGEAGTIQERKQ